MSFKPVKILFKTFNKLIPALIKPGVTVLEAAHENKIDLEGA